MTLPNFLIIGAAKAGTTSLYHYLDQHPDVFMSPIKETNYFAFRPNGDPYGREIRFPVRTADEYRRLFRSVTSEQAIGEASPLYLEYPETASKIHDCLPNIRLIVILREPADRALSAYSMRRRKGWEKGQAEDVITPDSHYVQNSLYYARLRSYFEFFPAEHIHLLLFDDLQLKTLVAVQNIFGFIGVNSQFEPNFQRRHNAGGEPRSEWLNQLLYSPFLRTWLHPVVPRTIRAYLRKIWRHNLVTPPDRTRSRLARPRPAAGPPAPAP